MAGYKAGLVFAAKAGVSAGLLAWLLRDMDWGRMAAGIRAFDLRCLAPVLLANALFILLRTWRFAVILRDNPGFALPFPTLLRYYLVSCFFSLLVPGGLAGDWARIAQVNRHGRSLGFSVQSVLLERYLGLLALLALACLLLLLPGSPVDLPPRGRLALLAALALGALPPVLALLRAYRALPLPAAWKNNLDRLSPATFAAASILSLALQAAALLVYWTLASALGLSIAPAVLAPMMLASSLATLLPISLQGLGITQAVFVHGLSTHGIAPESALVYSLSVFALDLATGLVGGTLFVTERRDGIAAGAIGADRVSAAK